MGGCATKPKVTKDGGVDAKAPELEPEHEALLQEHGDEEIVDDDQLIKPRSLSLLFKENEDVKVSTEKEKTNTEETKKPLEDAKTNDPTTKNESPKTEEKLSHETKNNETSTKQESESIIDEKPSLQNQITDPAEENVNTETAEETEKTSEETKINDPTEETEVKLEKAQSNELNEPIKEENLSETNQIDDVIVPLPEEKVIEVVLTKNAESLENNVVEAKSSIEEKNHVHDGVEHISEASDVGADKVSVS